MSSSPKKTVKSRSWLPARLFNQTNRGCSQREGSRVVDNDSTPRRRPVYTAQVTWEISLGMDTESGLDTGQKENVRYPGLGRQARGSEEWSMNLVCPS